MMSMERREQRQKQPGATREQRRKQREGNNRRKQKQKRKQRREERRKQRREERQKRNRRGGTQGKRIRGRSRNNFDEMENEFQLPTSYDNQGDENNFLDFLRERMLVEVY
jgi:hypothetical protein